jgi:hypothetical protein
MRALWAGLVAALCVAAWWYFKPVPAPVDTWHPATPAPQIITVPKTAIRPAKVSVYAPAAKSKLSLPQLIAADPAKHVLDASTIKADDHPQTIVTVIDEQTGDVQTFVRSEPLPWLAAEQRGELRFDVGVKNGLATVGRLTLREDLLQVKALHAGLNASADTDGSFFVGAGVGYRW